MITNIVRDRMRVGAATALGMAWSTIQATDTEPTGAALRTAAIPGKEFWIVFIVGLSFLVARVVLALWLPNPSRDQEAVFRTVLSLAAAGIGAAIPGLMRFESQFAATTISATGALTLFVLVYLLNPASPRKDSTIEQAANEAALSSENLRPLLERLDDLGSEMRALSARVKRLERSNDARLQKSPSPLTEDATDVGIRQ